MLLKWKGKLTSKYEIHEHNVWCDDAFLSDQILERDRNADRSFCSITLFTSELSTEKESGIICPDSVGSVVWFLNNLGALASEVSTCDHLNRGKSDWAIDPDLWKNTFPHHLVSAFYSQLATLFYFNFSWPGRCQSRGRRVWCSWARGWSGRGRQSPSSPCRCPGAAPGSILLLFNIKDVRFMEIAWK